MRVDESGHPVIVAVRVAVALGDGAAQDRQGLEVGVEQLCGIVSQTPREPEDDGIEHRRHRDNDGNDDQYVPNHRLPHRRQFLRRDREYAPDEGGRFPTPIDHGGRNEDERRVADACRLDLVLSRFWEGKRTARHESPYTVNI